MTTVLETDFNDPHCCQMAINGHLTIETVNDIWQQGCEKIRQSAGSPMIVDLSKVSHCDSAGVAMIIDWLRVAKKNNKQLILKNLPEQMRAIVEVSGLSKLFV